MVRVGSLRDLRKTQKARNAPRADGTSSVTMGALASTVGERQ